MSEPVFAASNEGSVMLDIGGDIGAMVLRVPPMLDGHEFEIEASDLSIPRTHSAVRERRLDSGTFYAAVYISLKEGDYRVVESGQNFTVVGGKITEVNFYSSDVLT
jgi:hypothetical protein